MNNIDIANYINEKCNKNIKTTILFLESILDHKFDYEFYELNFDYDEETYYISYNNIYLNIEIYGNGKNQVIDFILELLIIISNEEKEKIIESCNNSQRYSIRETQNKSKISNNTIDQLENSLMKLSEKTLIELRELINKETEYRSGPKIISFFNELGFNDSYEQGFPSRCIYTDEKLKKINGTPQIDQCIKNLFLPINFVGRFEELDGFIEQFNQYLVFDKWKVVREDTYIHIEKADDIMIPATKKTNTEKTNVLNEFLQKEFEEISFEKMGLEFVITSILNNRLKEIKICIANEANLSAIIMIGSTLEGVLFGVAVKYAEKFNRSNTSPKNKENDKVLPFSEWKFNNFIDVAHDIKILNEDVKKYSHVLRGFRNYIHPYQELNINSTPDEDTVKICFQVFKGAINQINNFIVKQK